MSVAQTIINQLGGNKFVVMCGVKRMVATENGLIIQLPSRFAKNGINCVTINLNGLDLYDVTFSKQHGVNVKQISQYNDIYNDMLVNLFETETGLYTRL